MADFSFTVIIEGDPDDLDNICENLYENGCDDSSVGCCEGVIMVSFNRESSSLASAIGSAISNIEKAGYTIDSIFMEKD